jgi:hypothetical protein
MATQPQGFESASQAEPLTQEQINQLKAAEADLASDLKQVGEEAKIRTSQISPDLLTVVEETERRGFVRQMVDAELARELFAQDARLARVFAVSGVFSDIKGTSPSQAIAAAMTKIRMGRAWGLNEADSMQFIYFTNGRPAVMNELIASKLQEAGWDWDVFWHQDAAKSCIGCTLFPKRKNAAGAYEYLMEMDPSDRDKQRKVEVSFTKADADRAMIWERGKQVPLSSKWNFVSWAQDMYFWRCIGRLKRRYIPSVLRGAMTVDEAREMEPEHKPELATLSLSSVKPSADENRGHDATAPQPNVSSSAPTITDVREKQKEVAKDKATQNAPKLIPAHVRALLALMDKVDRGMFWKVLGAAGYERIEDVPADEADAIIKELKLSDAAEPVVAAV